VVTGLLGVVLAVLLAGCGATTTVAVRIGGRGAGQVRVTVALDRAAAALGGTAVQDLDRAGLAAAGWAVRSAATPGGGETFTASHPFASAAQLPAVLGEIATSAGTPLFRLQVAETHTFWTTRTTLRGSVDLRCGVDCFGDAGLQGPFGSPVGVDPGALERRYGETAAQALQFRLQVRLPGSVGSVGATDATGRSGDTLRWTPVLGGRLTLSAVTTATDEGHVTEVAAAAAGLLVLGALAVTLLWRRRRSHPARARR
jgi:hypothetical protein